MKSINLYIIEKLHLNKDTKFINNDYDKSVLLISHSDESNTNGYCSFYYYEIENIDEDKQIVNLKNHKINFNIIPSNFDEYGKIFAGYAINKDNWGYILHKNDGIKLIKEILKQPMLEWKSPKKGKFRLEKPIGLRRDKITLEEYLNNLIDKLENGN